jgi:hypothetical protein
MAIHNRPKTKSLQDPALYAAGTVHRTFSSRDLRIVMPLIGGMVVSQIKGQIRLMKKYENPHNSLYYMLQIITWVEF